MRGEGPHHLPSDPPSLPRPSRLPTRPTPPPASAARAGAAHDAGAAGAAGRLLLQRRRQGAWERETRRLLGGLGAEKGGGAGAVAALSLSPSLFRLPLSGLCRSEPFRPFPLLYPASKPPKTPPKPSKTTPQKQQKAGHRRHQPRRHPRPRAHALRAAGPQDRVPPPLGGRARQDPAHPQARDAAAARRFGALPLGLGRGALRCFLRSLFWEGGAAQPLSLGVAAAGEGARAREHALPMLSHVAALCCRRRPHACAAGRRFAHPPTSTPRPLLLLLPPHTAAAR